MRQVFFHWSVLNTIVMAQQWLQVDFDQGRKPNLFQLRNHGKKPIYVAYNYIPSLEKYDKLIYPQSDDLFGTPIWRDRIYLFNPDDTSAEVTVYSDHVEDFPWEVQKNTTNVFIQGVSDGIKLTSDNQPILDMMEKNHENIIESVKVLS